MNKPIRRKRYVPAVGPKLKKLLVVVFVLFALLAVNAVYLSTITFVEWMTGNVYQNFFYQYMFLGHLALGLLIIVPIIVYGAIHIKNARNRPNKRAIRAGYVLFAVSILLLITGLTLTRGIPWIEIRGENARNAAYWIHAISPVLIAWLFVMHRLAGKRINWKAGGWVGGVAMVLTAIALVWQMQDPRDWNVVGPAEGEQYFFPSLARTASGSFIPAKSLMMDSYCQQCHADTHESWSKSMHRFSSFNNPAYLFSVRGTRQMSLQRDGDVQASRFCAGCHDPVPFFSGAFNDPNFDDVNHITSQVGISCTSCHAITHVNSVRGNADYTIEEPLHYPFAFSENKNLQALNRLLVKAKPEFHKKTFLKPLHKSTEFCGTCHKVHLPEELNQYKWLRGQNHYDAFLLSGVSGHGASSFYYPPKAQENCNGCHMKLQASDDFGAKDFDESDLLKIHDHQFPSANTAIPAVLGFADEANPAHQAMLKDSLRVDLFGLKKEGAIDGELIAPLDQSSFKLVRGQSYLLETVLRTLTLGHIFTQGTADSNQVWLELLIESDEQIVGMSGRVDPVTGEVDPWSHFVNAYVLDKHGKRIDRRNAEDIFTTLYNHQIPPGAADVVHYRFTVPQDANNLSITARLRYRKFDTKYFRMFMDDPDGKNDLPITTIAEASLNLPVEDGAEITALEPSQVATWERWNDYGIGLLRKQGSGELRQAEHAFRQVANLDRGDGDVNLARVYLREGRLDDAAQALQRAANKEAGAYPWTIAYLSGLVDKQNGYLEEAAENFENVVATNFDLARERGFDFSRDYRLLNELADTYFELAKLERGDSRAQARQAMLDKAVSYYQQALIIDPENATAHYGLAQTYSRTQQQEQADHHRQLHSKYKVDDNARDAAIATARRNDAAANHAADAIVIYDLQRVRHNQPSELIGHASQSNSH